MGFERVRVAIVLTLATGAGLSSLGAQRGARTPYSTWRDYGGSADSMQYSSLAQINKDNVNRLELAWFFPVPDRRGNF